MEFFTPAVWQLWQLVEKLEQLPAHSSWWISTLVQSGWGEEKAIKNQRSGNMSRANRRGENFTAAGGDK